MVLLVGRQLSLQPGDVPYFHTQILSDSLLTNTVCILCLLIAMPPGSDGEVLI